MTAIEVVTMSLVHNGVASLGHCFFCGASVAGEDPRKLLTMRFGVDYATPDAFPCGIRCPEHSEVTLQLPPELMARWRGACGLWRN